MHSVFLINFQINKLRVKCNLDFVKDYETKFQKLKTKSKLVHLKQPKDPSRQNAPDSMQSLYFSANQKEKHEIKTAKETKTKQLIKKSHCQNSSQTHLFNNIMKLLHPI